MICEVTNRQIGGAGLLCRGLSNRFMQVAAAVCFIGDKRRLRFQHRWPWKTTTLDLTRHRCATQALCLQSTPAMEKYSRHGTSRWLPARSIHGRFFYWRACTIRDPVSQFRGGSFSAGLTLGEGVLHLKWRDSAIHSVNQTQRPHGKTVGRLLPGAGVA